MPSWMNGTTCRPSICIKSTSFGDRHPVLVSVAERLAARGQLPATDGSHRPRHLGFGRGRRPGRAIQSRDEPHGHPSTFARSRSRQPRFVAAQPEAVHSQGILAASQGSTTLWPVHFPTLSVRKQSGRPMTFPSAKNFCNYAVASDVLIMPYGLGIVDEHDQVVGPAHGRLVGAGQVGMHRLHRHPRAQCCPPRHPISLDLCL